jgi:predicted enzyme related to lactoylglutathione lyase
MALIDGLMEVIVYVEDMNRAVAFYRDTLGLSVTFPAGLDDYGQEFWVTLATGQCTLALHGGGQRRQGQDAAKIVFRVTDVRAAREQLLARGVQLGEVRNPAPGVWVVDGRDSEGNPLSLEAHD